MSVARIGVLTVSDRAASGQYEDRGGPAVRDFLGSSIVSDHEFVSRVVPDEFDRIAEAIKDLVDAEGCCVVVTTGGTGPAPRDVTPEAIMSVCERMIPGFGEAMRAASMAVIPTAILSRQCAGTRGRSLVIALPGSPTAIADCLGAVIAAVPDCVDLLHGPRLEMHPRIGAYRPPDSTPRHQ